MAKHPVVHIELSAKNLGKAEQFYADLFGWKVEQIPEMNYASWQPDSGPGGGFNPVSDDNPAGTVLIYIASEDIELDLKKVEKLGGKIIMHRTEIPATGWFGIFEDPSGNRLGLYKPMGNPTASA